MLLHVGSWEIGCVFLQQAIWRISRKTQLMIYILRLSQGFCFLSFFKKNMCVEIWLQERDTIISSHFGGKYWFSYLRTSVAVNIHRHYLEFFLFRNFVCYPESFQFPQKVEVLLIHTTWIINLCLKIWFVKIGYNSLVDNNFQK